MLLEVNVNAATMVITFTISFTDLLKRRAVCLYATDCTVAFGSTFVRDYAGLDDSGREYF